MSNIIHVVRTKRGNKLFINNTEIKDVNFNVSWGHEPFSNRELTRVEIEIKTVIPTKNIRHVKHKPRRAK